MRPFGVKLLFVDTTRYKHLQEQLQQAHQELETAYEELQSTNEELETTNEELESTIEELRTTNEELQSTNEELETMNEELQSSNTEMETANEQLHERSEELDQLNSIFGSILASTHNGVIVLNRRMPVVGWNGRAEDLWGLQPEQVHHKNFLALDIGISIEAVMQSILACLNCESQFEQLALNAINRRGKPIQVQVTCTPLVGASNQVRGVIVAMQELQREFAQEAQNEA